LRLIAQIVQSDGDLPESRAELFRKSSDLLWREHNQLRSLLPLAKLSQEIALDAAGAACAALIITGSDAISLEVGGVPGEGVLRAADVSALRRQSV
jgi:hypothetical protein